MYNAVFTVSCLQKPCNDLVMDFLFPSQWCYMYYLYGYHITHVYIYKHIYLYTYIYIYLYIYLYIYIHTFIYIQSTLS